MQSLVQVFGDEFASHIGRSCPLPRELPFHKIVDWDASAGRFAYDLAYARSNPTGPIPPDRLFPSSDSAPTPRPMTRPRRSIRSCKPKRTFRNLDRAIGCGLGRLCDDPGS